MRALLSALRHAGNAAQGFREFRGSCGMTWADESKNEAYDFGRDLAHRLTMRRFDECR